MADDVQVDESNVIHMVVPNNRDHEDHNLDTRVGDHGVVEGLDSCFGGSHIAIIACLAIHPSTYSSTAN